jgi:hypothetical protein
VTPIGLRISAGNVPDLKRTAISPQANHVHVRVRTVRHLGAVVDRAIVKAWVAFLILADLHLASTTVWNHI